MLRLWPGLGQLLGEGSLLMRSLPVFPVTAAVWMKTDPLSDLHIFFAKRSNVAMGRSNYIPDFCPSPAPQSCKGPGEGDSS